ncbi:hypothetical protein CTAYLR_006412 [Chrysophaeum taylorii]|uniref:Multiple inositol polyphosphate phosphatase 1 n=1 Tax=Chrysophaeum taylorii TaxID=2483200 RepID=A0AAD7UA41_9STRA|nr:hypothetical protein CTAYLR_006412 [Chrysophaeum taylorii]
MGTKTAYSVPTGVGPPALPSSCGDAVMVNVVARHGSRQSSHIEELDELASRIGKPWKYPFAASKASLLLDRGLRESYDLARRLKAAYPRAFPGNEPFVATDFEVRATRKSRSVASAEAFALGALGATSVDVSSRDDISLRFFDHCPAYEASVDSDAGFSELDEYLRGPKIADALATFRHHLGNASLDDLFLAYEGCAYDFLLEEDARVVSDWCSLLGPRDNLLALEYAKDLEVWYESAGGNPLAPRAAVELIRDFFDAFATRRGAWRFAHAETLLPFATALGAFDAQPPLTAAYRDDTRLFKTSLVSPMAANLVAAAYPCVDETNRSHFRVKFSLNERDFQVPGCDDLYCDLGTLRDIFAAPLRDWNFTEICARRGPFDQRLPRP